MPIIEIHIFEAVKTLLKCIFFPWHFTKINRKKSFFNVFPPFLFTDKPENWDVWYESKFDDCDKEACLSFSKEILCARATVDHNYYAVCQNLLSRHAVWRGTSGGLLHDPPSEIAKDGRLEALLDECANPKKRYGRFQAAKELREYLAQLSNNVR